MTYSPALGEAICLLLEQNGNLRETCRTLGLSVTTVLRWSDDAALAPFPEQYARAKAAGLQLMASDLEAIADGQLPTMWPGTDVPMPPDPQRDRLRVDTRKWLLSKCLPKLYGDKLTAELTGPGGGPVEVVRRVIVDPKPPAA